MTVVALTGRTRRFCSTRCRVAAHRAQRLPVEMAQARRWVARSGKRPTTPAGRPASSTDPTTWTALAQVKGRPRGFVLGDGFACLDLDHCLVDGKPNALARRVLEQTPGAFVEVSPSGDGLHVWGHAPPLPGRMRGGVEAYSTGRYITVTGDVFRPGGLVDLTRFFT